MVGNDSTSKKKKTDVCKGENPTKAKKKKPRANCEYKNRSPLRHRIFESSNVMTVCVSDTRSMDSGVE